MLLELVIGGSVLSVCITSIALYGIKFAKQLHDDEFAVEKQELDFIKKNQEQEQAEKARLIKQKEEEEELKNLPSREDSFLVLEGVSGELLYCPFCKWKHEAGSRIPTGSICKSYMDKNDPVGLRSHNWNEKNITGPSSGLAIKTKSGTKLYQCCARCCGEWLTSPETFKKETKPPVIPKKK